MSSSRLDTTAAVCLTAVVARPNTLRTLIDIRLTETGGTNLDTTVVDARMKRQSWRTIAADITTTTGVVVSHETLRSWYRTRQIN